jgi:hypothetical protein
MKEKVKEMLPRLGAAFAKHGFPVKLKDGIEGRGLYETDLEQNGFKKKYLEELTTEGAIQKVTTVYQNTGWRNTYVLVGNYMEPLE